MAWPVFPFGMLGSQDILADILIVAGGAGGAGASPLYTSGGGGGAGGLRYLTLEKIARDTTYTVTIGGG